MPDGFDDFDSLEVSADADLAPLAQLFDKARGAATPEEIRAERTIVTSMVDLAINQHEGPVGLAARQPRSRRIGTKTAVRLAAIGAVVLAGASAAAAGQLPDDAQSFVARTTSHFGLRLPDPSTDESSASSTVRKAATSPVAPTDNETNDSLEQMSTSTTTTPASLATPTTTITIPSGVTPVAPSSTADDRLTIGPDPTGPAKHGLCEAWRAHQSNPSNANDNAVSMARLLAAATDAGQSVEEFCADVLGTESETTVPTTSPPPGATEEENAESKDKGTKPGHPPSTGGSATTSDTNPGKGPHK